MMELVIAKWNKPHNGAEYTMHFSEDDDWFTVVSEVDAHGDLRDCRIRLIDTWSSSTIDASNYREYKSTLKYMFNELGTEYTSPNNETKETYDALK